MGNKKLDILEFNINRIDGYIEKADNKANFMLALNGIIIGILFSNSKGILNFIKISKDWKVLNLIIWLIVLTLFILSTVFALFTITPRKSKNNSRYKSILYYNDIEDLKKYRKLLELKTKKIKNIENEFSTQVVELSKICRIKMWSVRNSILLFILSAMVSVLYGIIYSINYIY